MARLRGAFGALGERPFRLLWSGQALSSAGDALLPVAIAFAVLDLTGSPADLGLVLASALVPRVALMLVGGVWADRLPRHLVMMAADLVRAVSQGLIALALLAGVAELWHLLVAGVVYGTARAFFDPASTGLVPETISAPRLQQANALMGLTRSGLRVAGPPLAGVLVAVFSPGLVFAVDAATFALSAFFLALLHVPALDRPARTTFVAELAAGWRELRARTWVWVSIAYFSIWNLAIASFYVLGPVVADDELGGASAWGLILAGTGVGSIVGGAWALRFRPKRPLLAGYALCLCTAVQPLALVRPLPTLAIAAATAVGVTAVTVSNVLWITSLQEHVPREAISRVSAYEWVGSSVVMPLGYALAGPLAELLGFDVTLWIAAAILFSSTLVVLALPSVRAVRRATTATEPPVVPAGSPPVTSPPTAST